MNRDELRKIRLHLHQNPELSGQEWQTQKFISGDLKKLGVEDITTLAQTGVMARIASGTAGPCVLVRADTDALPITEENDFGYRSRNEGVSHKCGHDGHSTILLGVAAELQKDPPKKGEVVLLFQPAEENGTGAAKVLDDAAFSVKPDFVFALHNLPGFPRHQVVCRPGSFTTAVKSIIIKLKGQTSHAAEPEKGINPGLAIAEILQLSESLSIKDVSSEDFRLVSMIHVKMGEKAYGVSAGYGEVHLTLRSRGNRQMEQLENEMIRNMERITGNYRLQLETEWLEVFHANQNHQEAFDIIKKVAQQQDLHFEEPAEPFKWGEDFGLFTSKYKGAMFGIGAGEDSPALHNADYDFPDEITPTGVRMFEGIIKEILK